MPGSIPRVIPPDGDTWVGVTAEPLPIGALHDWAVDPGCGGIVLFSGTVRDHADGRPGVSLLEYEAYEEQVVPRLRLLADEVRSRYPGVRKVGLVHRVGPLAVGESSVVTVVSAPHRPEAFAAGRFAIDGLKASAPIWKREVWEGGEDWGLAATDVVEPSAVTAAEAEAGAATDADGGSGR